MIERSCWFSLSLDFSGAGEGENLEGADCIYNGDARLSISVARVRKGCGLKSYLATPYYSLYISGQTFLSRPVALKQTRDYKLE